MPGANCMIVCALPNCQVLKNVTKTDRHLNYVEANIEKKIRKIKLKYFKEYFLF